LSLAFGSTPLYCIVFSIRPNWSGMRSLLKLKQTAVAIHVQDWTWRAHRIRLTLFPLLPPENECHPPKLDLVSAEPIFIELGLNRTIPSSHRFIVPQQYKTCQTCDEDFFFINSLPDPSSTSESQQARESDASSQTNKASAGNRDCHASRPLHYKDYQKLIDDVDAIFAFLLHRSKRELCPNKPNYIQTSPKEQSLNGISTGKKIRIGNSIDQCRKKITEYWVLNNSMKSLVYSIIDFGNNMPGYHAGDSRHSFWNSGLRITQVPSITINFLPQIGSEWNFYDDILFSSEYLR
jgi:hypothetical protein